MLESMILYSVTIVLTFRFVMGLDPCVSYTFLGHADRRSPSYVITGSISTLCDNFITPGWYRVNGSSGGDIPTKCVPTLSCGTFYPVWMDGTIPEASDGIVNRKACMSDFQDVCCSTSWTIQVKSCSDFRIYYLTKTGSCPSSYCFGAITGSTTPTHSESTGRTGATAESTTPTQSESTSSTGVTIDSTTLTQSESTRSTMTNSAIYTWTSLTSETTTVSKTTATYVTNESTFSSTTLMKVKNLAKLATISTISTNTRVTTGRTTVSKSTDLTANVLTPDGDKLWLYVLIVAAVVVVVLLVVIIVLVQSRRSQKKNENGGQNSTTMNDDHRSDNYDTLPDYSETQIYYEINQENENTNSNPYESENVDDQGHPYTELKERGDITKGKQLETSLSDSVHNGIGKESSLKATQEYENQSEVNTQHNAESKNNSYIPMASVKVIQPDADVYQNRTNQLNSSTIDQHTQNNITEEGSVTKISNHNNMGNSALISSDDYDDALSKQYQTNCIPTNDQRQSYEQMEKIQDNVRDTNFSSKPNDQSKLVTKTSLEYGNVSHSTDNYENSIGY